MEKAKGKKWVLSGVFGTIGGVVGLIGGPLGAGLGSAAGGSFGYKLGRFIEKKEKKDIKNIEIIH